MQEEVGLKAITDGEFRRTYFHIDFLKQLDGVQSDDPKIVIKADGSEELAPPVMRVTSKVKHARDIQRADFEFLKANTQQTPKVTIPSPTMLHFRGGRAGISQKDYPDLEQFYADVAQAYGDELRSLAQPAAPTCRWTTRISPTSATRRCARRRALAATIRTSCRIGTPTFINRVVAQKPAGMTLAVHLCRGNFKSAHAAEGGYEPVAEALLSEMKVDAYFLEYDDERSGDFRPLRFLPKGKIVVLGLITTKLGALESKDDIKRRIDEAAKYVPLEQLALSPQCGFSSSYHGNDIQMSQQTAKLRLVVDIAREVWG